MGKRGQDGHEEEGSSARADPCTSHVSHSGWIVEMLSDHMQASEHVRSERSFGGLVSDQGTRCRGGSMRGYDPKKARGSVKESCLETKKDENGIRQCIMNAGHEKGHLFPVWSDPAVIEKVNKKVEAQLKKEMRTPERR